MNAAEYVGKTFVRASDATKWQCKDWVEYGDEPSSDFNLILIAMSTGPDGKHEEVEVAIKAWYSWVNVKVNTDRFNEGSTL